MPKKKPRLSRWDVYRSTQEELWQFTKENFFSRVIFGENEGECDVWVGSVDKRNGSPIFYMVGRRRIAAQRFSYSLVFGEIEKGDCLSRSCANNLCVKVEHAIRRPRKGYDTKNERFWELWKNIDKAEGCWRWSGGFFTTGYGSFSENGKNIGAHRVAYEMFVGPIPEGLYVLHHCDNPPCVRPDHLRLGTPVENSADMKTRGRGAKGDNHPSRLHPENMKRGEENGNSKLTNDGVRQIISSFNNERTPIALLAIQYGVSGSTINGIVKNKTWKWIRDEDRTSSAPRM